MNVQQLFEFLKYHLEYFPALITPSATLVYPPSCGARHEGGYAKKPNKSVQGY